MATQITFSERSIDSHIELRARSVSLPVCSRRTSLVGFPAMNNSASRDVPLTAASASLSHRPPGRTSPSRKAHPLSRLTPRRSRKPRLQVPEAHGRYLSQNKHKLRHGNRSGLISSRRNPSLKVYTFRGAGDGSPPNCRPLLRNTFTPCIICLKSFLRRFVYLGRKDGKHLCAEQAWKTVDGLTPCTQEKSHLTGKVPSFNTFK